MFLPQKSANIAETWLATLNTYHLGSKWTLRVSPLEVIFFPIYLSLAHLMQQQVSTIEQMYYWDQYICMLQNPPPYTGNCETHVPG